MPSAVARAPSAMLRQLYDEAAGETLDEHAIHLRLAHTLETTGAARRTPTAPADIGRVAGQARHPARARRQPAQVPARDRHPRHQLRGRPGRHRQTPPRRSRWRRDALSQSRDSGDPNWRSRLAKAGLPARRPDPEGRSLPAPAVRRPVRNAGRGQRWLLPEKNVCRDRPLAYMRGRTLNDAFVILDEAQNTTIEQMKMFPNPPRLRQHGGGHRRHDPDRPAAPREVGLRMWSRCCAWRA